MRKLNICCPLETIELSQIIIGTNKYGTTKTENQAFEQLDLFVDELGGTTIDTATVYGETEPGISKSELVIGKWLRNRRRRDVKIITKACCYKLNAKEKPRLTPEALQADLFQSLEALNTDYVDVLLLHRDDLSVPVDEMIDALDSYVSKGLIRAIGVSNWWINRILEANAYAAAQGRARFVVSEVQWSYVPQTVGKELHKEEDNAWMTDREYDKYRAANIPVLAYLAQARGYIPKYLSGSNMQNGSDQFDNQISRERAFRACEISKVTGYTPTQISLAYLLHSGLSSAVLVGASSEEQLRDSCSCENVTLTREQIIFLRGSDAIG